jgi:hypothetical protein
MNIGRKAVLILSLVFVLGALVNCGGGSSGGTDGSGDPQGVTRVPGDYAGVGPVVTDGTWLAWIAREKDQVMGHAGGSGADTGSTVSDLSSEDWYPNDIAFDGRYLVAAVQDGDNMEIVYLDTEGSGPYVEVTDNALSDYRPVVHDGVIVWYANDGSDNEIFYYDIADPGQGVVQLTDNANNDRSPDIEGGKIVWYGSDGSDNEIFYYDLNAAAPTVIQVSDDVYNNGSPKVDEGGVVVWKMDDGSSSQIFYADMSLGAATFTPVQLTFGAAYDYHQDVHVDGRKLVWENGTIHYCDIDAGSGTTVVTVVSPVGSNYTPGISGDRIVWQGFDGDGEIYSHVIGDPVDSVLKVTDNSLYDGYPVIDGNIAVFRTHDGNNSYYLYRYDFSTSELIRLYDEQYLSVMNGDYFTMGGDTYWLTTGSNYHLYAAPIDGSSPVRTVTPPDLEAYNVDIDEGVIAYQTYGDYFEIHYADLNAVSFTTVQITHNTDYSENPSISSGVIVWEEYVDAQGDYEIFYYDINAPVPTLVNVSKNASYDDEDADIDNGIVTWRASDGSDYEIWYADISVGASTMAVVRVSDNTFADYRPRIDGGIITWYGIDGDYEIYYADVGAGASTFTVKQLTDNETDDSYSVISNGIITWAGEGTTDSDDEIYYADVSVGASTVQVVELTSNDVSDWDPEIAGGLITWYADTDDSDYEIYYYDLNSAAPEVTQATDNLFYDYAPATSGGVITWYTDLSPYCMVP